MILLQSGKYKYGFTAYQKSGCRNGKVVNTEPKFWRPEREETDADDAKDDDGANAPVVPGNGVVQPHVGVRCVQENLK